MSLETSQGSDCQTQRSKSERVITSSEVACGVMQKPRGDLLDLPKEIFLSIVSYVAEKDVQADGEILSLRAICSSLSALAQTHVNQCLKTRS